MKDEKSISYTFSKYERLKSRKDIDLLFRSRQSVFAFPIKVVYRIIKEEKTQDVFQAAFTVPKRSFKKAVDRNLLKRRMKEAYRLQRNTLKNHCKLNGICIQMMFIYTAKKEQPYGQIEKGVRKVLKKIESTLSEH